MESRKIAFMVAAGFIGLGLTAAAASAADAKPRASTVTVEGKRFDPQTQRRVSYADLNLAFKPQQRVLHARIVKTSNNLCEDLGYWFLAERSGCARDAIHSTDGQVAAAIQRAVDQMAGREVGPAIAISIVAGAR